MRFALTAFFASIATLAPVAAAAQDVPATSGITLATGAPMQVEAITAALDTAAQRYGVNGFALAIVNNGELVLEHNYGIANVETSAPVTGQTLFEFASMSKPVFGALVVDLAEEGVIDLDRPLAEYYPHPDLPDHPEAALITARQVLTHQTGLPNWRSDNPHGQLDFAFAPGTGYRYSGEGYEYLADVLMHVLDTDERGLDAVFRERIALPAGASDTFFAQDAGRVARKALGYANGERYSGESDYAGGEFGAAYSIHSTAGDYARLMIGLMSGASLSASERDTFLAPQNVAIPEDHPARPFGFVDQALGYAIHDLPMGRVYVHGGNNEGFTGTSVLFPAAGWAFVIVSNENQANDFTLEAALLLLGLAPPAG